MLAFFMPEFGLINYWRKSQTCADWFQNILIIPRLHNVLKSLCFPRLFSLHSPAVAGRATDETPQTPS